MSPANINTFMSRMHDIERRLGLFDDTVNGDYWWDTVRFDACYFLFSCLSDPSSPIVYGEHTPGRRLGPLRRAIQRRLLFARAAVAHRDLMVLRAPRSRVAGQLHDLVIDPIVDLFPTRARIIDTLPRRYHLPEFRRAGWPGKVPVSLPDVVAALLNAFGISARHSCRLGNVIRHRRAEYESQVAGYHDLFDKVRPGVVLLVQNGIEKALFHVANVRGVPAVEAQHGLIGHSHMGYSYPRGVDYGRQTGMPQLFLTFSNFWQESGFYPARQQEIVGTDCFATGGCPVGDPLGAILIVSANIYHDDLQGVTRDLAARMPDRRFIYKLHPNQRADEDAIRAAFADVANVEVGSALTPASRIMDDISHVFTVQSTVVYEALQNGRRVCILPRQDYHVHSDIFALPGVSLLDSTAEIAAALAVPCVGTVRPTFFEPFNPARAHDLLAGLLDRNSGRARS